MEDGSLRGPRQDGSCAPRNKGSASLGGRQ
jgi:hypothetical protein